MNTTGKERFSLTTTMAYRKGRGFAEQFLAHVVGLVLRHTGRLGF